MRKKAAVNIAAVIGTAAVSAVILYETMVAGSLLQEAGLLGIFLAAMFSHLTVIARDMFVPAFMNLMAYYNPLLLGFVAGLGAAVGEVSTYYWGLGIQEAFQEDSKSTMVKKWIDKYGFLAILLVASSPFPDTPIILLAGTARFPFKKFLATEIVGKVIYYSLGAVVGGAIFQGLSNYVEEWVLSAAVLVASIVLCVLASWGRSREWILRIFRRVLH